MTLSAGLVSEEPPRVTGPGMAVLRFPARAGKDHAFVQSRLGRLNDLAREQTGQSWVFSLELEGGSGGVLRERRPEGGESPVASPQPAVTAASLLQERSEIEKIPLVNRAIEIFHAEILHFDKRFGKNPAKLDSPQSDS